jgi:hypothetical protein
MRLLNLKRQQAFHQRPALLRRLALAGILSYLRETGQTGVGMRVYRFRKFPTIPDSEPDRKETLFFADRPGGGCSRIPKESLRVSGLEDDLFESGMTPTRRIG